MSILSRNQNPERTLLDAKFNRTIADQFAVELYRHSLIAFHAQPSSLEILDLGNTNVRTKHDILQIFDDLKITEPLEDNDVEKTVIECRTLKNGNGPPYKRPLPTRTSDPSSIEVSSD